ncbi:DUF1634 domain-containing protein [Alloacidobacterium sp.]|uniref:DUF1634 domain-containing protein n=1 Tax=Alloacidobacterium sp. TaxID=2951999 RepID=UPI002D43BA4F|nr:DUF1634 domain-containing protein [Alloacidobacterium sp.]HYK37079.1 DUF1634 domain-containing protein [Alloacidobacterium sp.]
MMNDEKMDLAIGRLLRAGVLIAAAVVLVGGLLYLNQKRGPRPDYSVFHGAAAELRSPAGIVRHLSVSNSGSIMQLGLLLLIATPVARVAFAAFGFLLEKDWLYVVVSLIVFAVLMYSLLYDH